MWGFSFTLFEKNTTVLPLGCKQYNTIGCMHTIIMPACTAVFDTFHPLSCDVLSSLISKLNKTTCVLEPFPTKLLISHLFYIIDIILCIVNLCFSSGVFPTACKSSIIFPLIKKQGLDPEILKNYRPVANLSFKNY